MRRNAEELSTTVAPASTNRCAQFREVVAPAENSAMSIPLRSASSFEHLDGPAVDLDAA